MSETKLTTTGNQKASRRRVNMRSRSSQSQLRKIPKAEVQLLKAIWKWKVLSYLSAKKLCFDQLSHWSFYEKLRRLIAEGYIIERDGPNLDFSVLQLSKKGFEYLKHDLGFLKENRFAAQSVSHDYWATAFQIGEFAIFPSPDAEFFTEQELQCTEDSLLPEWVPRSREHFPDGFTRIKNEQFDSVFAIEVDLNLKPPLRYVKSGYYYDGLDSKTDVVFWLCDGKNLMERIVECLNSAKLRRVEIHHFVLLEDFKKLGWQAPVRSGREQNKTIHDIYLQRGPQGLPKEPPRAIQVELQEIFLSKKKSPWVSKSY